MATINIRHGRIRPFVIIGVTWALIFVFVYLSGIPALPPTQHRLCQPIEDFRNQDSQITTTVPSPGALYDSTTAWSFNGTRDERAFGLSSKQCTSAFPELLREIERATQHRKQIGKVSNQELDISLAKNGLVRAMIVDQHLYILDASISGSDYHISRALAVLHSIHRAIITSPTLLPNVEFTFSVADIADEFAEGRTVWAFTRRAEQVHIWLMPDFGYWSWPLDLVGSYEQIRSEIKDIEIPFREKKQQVVWRGAIKTNKQREQLMKITKDKEWADVKGITWKNADTLKAGEENNAISTPDHCLYQYVLQTEGHSYSGRGKYLHNCNSVVIIPKRKWIQPYHTLLKEGENFIEVEEDLSNLEEKVLEMLRDQAKAERIAQNNVDTFRDRYLTPAAQNCQWRQLIESWAQVSPVPELWERRGEDSKRKMRGTPFETFV